MTKVEKKYNRNFTLIQNKIFEFNDKLPKGRKMSFKAIGIFLYLWHLPDNWNFHESEIINHASDGITSFRSGRAKLEEYGFVTKTRIHDKHGYVKDFKWVLDDKPEFKPEYLKPPVSGFPKQDKPKQGYPKQDNQHLQSTYGTKYLGNKVRGSSGSDSKNQNSSQKSVTAFKLYQRIYKQFPNGVITQDLHDFTDKYGNDLVCYALKIAGRNNVSLRGISRYLDRILTEWSKLGIKTIEQAKKQNEEHIQQNERNYQPRKHYGRNNRPQIKEKLPDWARDDYHPKYKKADKATREKVQAKLRKLNEDEKEQSND